MDTSNNSLEQQSCESMLWSDEAILVMLHELRTEYRGKRRSLGARLGRYTREKRPKQDIQQVSEELEAVRRALSSLPEDGSV